MEYSFLEIIIYFITYSFLGWVMESIFRSISEKKIINTGFLKGPFCPIYGVGAIIMLLFLKKFADNLAVLFIVSVVVLTIWEYLVGVLLEKLFHTKYWDYSKNKFNFQGRICLMNSIFWGVLGVVFVKYIHPAIESLGNQIDIKILTFIYAILGIIILVDMIVSIVKIKNIKTTLEKIEKLNDEIKQKLKELAEQSITKKANKEESQINNKIEILENIQVLIEQLKYKRNKTILHLYKNVYRLKKAFPAINTKEITEVLNKKVELKEVKEEIKQRIEKRKRKNKKAIKEVQTANEIIKKPKKD